MQTVKFEALSIRDAIKKVREDLGKDAVIISTRELQKPLTAGGTPQKVVEVIASPAVSMRKLTDEPGHGIYKPTFPVINTKEKVTVLRNGSRSTLPPSGRAFQSAAAQQSLRPEVLTRTQHPLPAQTPLEQGQHFASVQTSPRLNPETPESRLALQTNEIQSQLGYLRSEIKSLPQINFGEQMQEVKVLLHEIIRNQSGTNGTAVKRPEIENMCIKLRSAGVVSSIIADLSAFLEAALPMQTPPSLSSTTSEHVLAQTIKYILKNVKVADPFNKNNVGQTIHCLIGPTGAGKTTTIAKIAASLKLKHQQQIGLVSLDTQRISASDQLRVYSKILDVPFFESSKIEDLPDFIEKSDHLNAVFLDTAGRSAFSNEQSDFLKRLKMAPIPVQFHLVLPAMMKQRDLEETVRAYNYLDIASVIFTKLDESWSFGEIFNISSLFKIPLSYFGVGQNVPEDLEIATKERVIERLLRI
jgi:flagellar biosynthesis protein FlhF